ncbi:hypothetical protein AQJ84_04380 [Streptomyces resistomycificus]|uniref:Uncharacterized protein n=1 Tax=Streptomyces resistomycificus TaxID=67356 RepID=A0A0L8KTW2_9ACTN|nr:hypothetical protein ADK37_37180 [Streptomyces resistomycificus]KUO01675.1 hypothetical protein AQJ84_04380 [Streptomyces resistomycificus]
MLQGAGPDRIMQDEAVHAEFPLGMSAVWGGDGKQGAPGGAGSCEILSQRTSTQARCVRSMGTRVVGTSDLTRTRRAASGSLYTLNSAVAVTCRLMPPRPYQEAVDARAELDGQQPTRQRWRTLVTTRRDRLHVPR